ncbi:BlaR1 family beta-lactam sensor/signal transducer [Caldalkalibacillus salinus]|uniref:BlaR1 family beta-lactam sensor/signal transducer n=1 Tax=Caldalkalibacillus salinus TaxID=2803787 RepID=UPI0019214336|nr:BlaR1 family beta-lactam sensor/signal transducer [Caldalkalibacillus salinus]
MDLSFFTPFLISHLLLSVILCIIIFIKKAVKSHITVNSQYHMSLISLLALVAPFIPLQSQTLQPFYDWIMSVGMSESNASDSAAAGNTTQAMLQNTHWLQDFSMSIEQSSFGMMEVSFFLLWITGMIAVLLMTLSSILRIGKIKKSLHVVENKPLLTVFSACKKKLHIHKDVILGHSSLVKSPITFGLIRPYIVLPDHMSMFSTEELKCVLLHELYHCKRRDMLVNYVMCLFQTVYWFNPLVWYFLREMKTEMEMSCDYAVLTSLEQEAHLNYAEVILKFASLSQRTSSLLTASEMSHSYKQVKRRLATILNFQAESRPLKLKSALVFVTVLAVILMSIPSLSVMAMNKDKHDFAYTNVTYKNDNFFDERSGSAVLYDASKDQYTIYNEEESTTRYAPASTYKIFSALFALESGIITKEDSNLTWDGTVYQYEEWHQDHDLFSAMESSATWYFQHLDQQMGKETLQHYYEQINYGNRNLSGHISDYWLDSLKISPVEQVELLKKFYLNDFEFAQTNVETVKDALLLEESNGLRLYCKTGTAVLNGEDIDGWFVGYVESRENYYVFAVHIQGDKQSGGRAAANIALAILEEEGIYQSTTSPR